MDGSRELRWPPGCAAMSSTKDAERGGPFVPRPLISLAWAGASLPWLGVLMYLIAQHDGMQRRSVKQAQAQRQEFDSYVREAAGGGSTADIAKAKELLDSGAITQQEFETLKAKALA
jgi:hypothetical protein